MEIYCNIINLPAPSFRSVICRVVVVVCQGPALRCSADVLFPRTERHSAPDVKLRCEALQQINRTVQEEEAFYQKHIPPDSAVSARDIPDSYGNMSEEMQPFWRLARVAASFIMLRESSENTEFNMVQMASVTQQVIELALILHVFLNMPLSSHPVADTHIVIASRAPLIRLPDG
uniref:Cystatin LXN-type domain-containing protein n=1 Tax=Sinocyclocheilus grahami TaxID=75366 RepID=A0A672QAL2_SINGR